MVDVPTTVIAAAEEAIPRDSHKVRTVSWWKRELELERRNVRRLRRRINTGPVGDRDVRKDRYTATRNRYYAMVRQEKKLAWENFLP